MINGVNVAGQTASTFTTTSLSSGSAVSVMMTSNDPCANPVAPVQSQSITITSGAPVLMITNPPAVCAPASVDLTAALVTAGSQAGLVFSYWLDANATTPLTNPNAVMNAGTYYIKVQDAGGCFITKPVNVSIEQKINGIRYPDVTAAANSPLQLNARSPGTGYLYSWSPPTGLNLSNIKDPVFINNTGLEYLIRITSPAGCITVDTQLVKLTPVVQFQTPDIFVPKAWSPNGDGHNDLLFPFLVNITELKYFRIYDRWGQKVFETNSNGKGWDGVYNGKQQLPDVYTWVIEAVGVDGKTIRRSGNAVLLR
jgi:gliding motility-associated-like protein